MLLVLYIAAAICTALCLEAELRRCLMMLQQNSYRYERYMRWLRTGGDATSFTRLTGIIVLLISLVPKCPEIIAVALSGLFAIIIAMVLWRRKYKKPLVMTMRARRIYFTCLVLCVLIAGAAMALCKAAAPVCDAFTYLYAVTMAFLGCYCGSHIIIVAANALLTPVEKSITRKYYNEAARILASMPDLRVIGITGSYGKTTTKHYLTRILSEKYETLMTPGSYNTTMGVVRTIREYLQPFHEVFVCEMGAKCVGDIKEICDLVHPECGIITAVGPQHLESFKSIENVQSTKFELADSLPANGLALVNNDFAMIANRPVDNCRCLRYAIKNTEGADYIASDIAYSPHGTTFTVVRTADDHTLPLKTHLVGECNISNLLAAVAMAQHLGVDDRRIAYAVDKIEQVEHRLSIKRIPGSYTIIDDAFNSNPVGSAMALDVLAGFEGGKRILVTPGMIELGTEQYHANHDFGLKAATCCDIAIIVGEYNREAITEGLRDGGMPSDCVFTPDTFAQAQELLRKHASAGDTVLYENDLPDTFK